MSELVYYLVSQLLCSAFFVSSNGAPAVPVVIVAQTFIHKHKQAFSILSRHTNTRCPQRIVGLTTCHFTSLCRDEWETNKKLLQTTQMERLIGLLTWMQMFITTQVPWCEWCWSHDRAHLLQAERVRGETEMLVTCVSTLELEAHAGSQRTKNRTQHLQNKKKALYSQATLPHQHLPCCKFTAHCFWVS